DGVAVAGEHRAIGLTGDLAGLQDQLATTPVEFLAEVIEHSIVLAMRGIGGRQAGRSVGPDGREAASRVAWMARAAFAMSAGAAAGHVAGNAVAIPTPRVTGTAVCRSAACRGVRGQSLPSRRCPAPPWSGGRRRCVPYGGKQRLISTLTRRTLFGDLSRKRAR